MAIDKTRSSTDDPLLPDFCRGEGLLLLIVSVQLLALFVVVVRSGMREFDWLLLGNSAFLALWITLFLAALLCLLRKFTAGWNPARAATLHFGAVLLMAAVAGLLRAQFFGVSDSSRIDYWSVLDTVIIVAIPAGILLRMLYLQQQVRIQQRAELESRINALQARIRPHFLFNSMNSIASMIGVDADKAERMVEDLSELFRYALGDNNQRVSLAEEVAISLRYLAIEQLRLGDRMKVSCEALPEEVVDLKVPALLIQPLVENAVYHGIQPRVEGGELTIRFTATDNQLLIRIDNPMPQAHPDTSGNRVALNNTQQRLQAYYGSRAKLQSHIEQGHFCCALTLPIDPSPISE